MCRAQKEATKAASRAQTSRDGGWGMVAGGVEEVERGHSHSTEEHLPVNVFTRGAPVPLHWSNKLWSGANLGERDITDSA